MSDRAEEETYAVLVIDLFHFMDEEGETLVGDFATWADARDYARARAWSSVQELRTQGMSGDELRAQWLSFGENALVVGGPSYSARNDIDYFIANQPRVEDLDWLAIAHRAGARVQPK